ncbi:MAG: hypothetical protein CMJ50_00570, partial [Planctomycetaceae bacterium]|nr:hypothetical protein [Planctomycetaceae bacterium]
MFHDLIEQLLTREQEKGRKKRVRTERRAAFRRELMRPLQLEPLEDRRLLAYTATLVGGSVALTGGAAADTLTVDTDGGGLLRHNRFTALDAGFMSDNDFISGNGASDDTIMAAAVTSLTATDPSGNDAVVLAQSPTTTTNALTLTGGTLSASGFTSITDNGNLAISGSSDFAAGTITLGSGTFNVGTLTFNSVGAVVISEDSGTDIIGVNTAGSLDLDGSGSINGAGLITAASVDLDAATGIGNTTALELAATSISADTTSGNVD